MRCFRWCTTPKEVQLFEAVRGNNPLRVHRLLRETESCLRMEVDNVGSTLLHVAGQLGHTTVIEELCEVADREFINRRNQHGFSALHEAAINGRARAVEALLEGGADVDCEGPSRSSPLHLACSRGNNGALRALVGSGANIEAHGWNRERPLHMAARKGRRETCMLLLELGADPDALDGIGRRPWQVAESQFAGLTTPKGALGVRQTLAEALKPENVARAAAANSVSEDQRIEQWIEHHATCLAQPEATEPNADCLRESALSASSVSGANGRLEAHTISFDSVLSVPPPPLSSSPDGGGGGGDHGDERVAVWQHQDAYTMLHVTTAIPRTLALGHIAFRLNASDVAVVQVAVKAVGMEPCRSPPDAGTLRHERIAALATTPVNTNAPGAHPAESSLNSLPSPANRRTLLEPLNDVSSSFPPNNGPDPLLKASLKPIYGDRQSSLGTSAPSLPTSPTQAALAQTSDSHPFGMEAPAPSESPRVKVNKPELPSVLEPTTPPLASASAQLSPGPGLFRCTFVLVDGIAGEPLSGERRHALREAVVKAVAAAHAAYPEAAAMLSSAMGVLKKRATLSPLPRTSKLLDVEDPDTIFQSFQ